MINGLLNHLKAETSIPFVFMAWSHSPDNVYGVVTVSDQAELDADADAVSEKMLEGYVDVFTRTTGGNEMNEVEACLRGLGIWFGLESIQFEEQTGYIHYEWKWKDTNGKASENVALIVFDLHGQVTEAWMPYGVMPVPPEFTPVYLNNSGVTDGGVWVTLAEWDKPIVAVSGNAEYIARLGIEVMLAGANCLNAKEDSPISDAGYPSQFVYWKQSAYDLMKQVFEEGYMVCTHSSTGLLMYYMTELDGTEALFMQVGGTVAGTYQIRME